MRKKILSYTLSSVRTEEAKVLILSAAPLAKLNPKRAAILTARRIRAAK